MPPKKKEKQDKFPYKQKQLEEAGLVGEGLSKEVREIIEDMRERPRMYCTTLDLLKSTNEHALFWEKVAAVREHPEKLSTTTDGSPYAVSEYEKWFYYFKDKNTLIYRSDLHTNPFPIPPPGTLPPNRRLDYLLGGAHLALREAWHTAPACAHPQVCDILTARGIKFYDACLFRVREGDEDEDVWPVPPGRPIVWILVRPGAVTAEVAHEVGEEIFALLEEKGIARGDLEVEWAEGHMRTWGTYTNYVELAKKY